MRHPPLGHGSRCTCQALALAVGIDPRRLSFNYCRSVLQRRWRVCCNHGGDEMECSGSPDGKWCDYGRMDPVKAILVVNE